MLKILLCFLNSQSTSAASSFPRLEPDPSNACHPPNPTLNFPPLKYRREGIRGLSKTGGGFLLLFPPTRLHLHPSGRREVSDVSTLPPRLESTLVPSSCKGIRSVQSPWQFRIISRIELFSHPTYFALPLKFIRTKKTLFLGRPLYFFERSQEGGIVRRDDEARNFSRESPKDAAELFPNS